MKSVNKVLLIGNVTRDVELRATTGGQPVCTFGLATNRVWRDQQGQRQSLPEFHNLVAWGRLAEFCEQYIKKGKPLYIEGYLKTRSWENEQKHKQYRTEIVLEDVVLLGSRPSAESEESTPDEAIREGEAVPEEA